MAGHLPGRGFKSLPESLSLFSPLSHLLDTKLACQWQSYINDYNKRILLKWGMKISTATQKQVSVNTFSLGMLGDHLQCHKLEFFLVFLLHTWRISWEGRKSKTLLPSLAVNLHLKDGMKHKRRKGEDKVKEDSPLNLVQMGVQIGTVKSQCNS